MERSEMNQSVDENFNTACCLSSVMLSSCGFATRSEVNERPEAATSGMKIHAENGDRKEMSRVLANYTKFGVDTCSGVTGDPA
jgi:hypothetical protein